MKVRKFKFYYALFKVILNVTALFWFGETLWFLLVEGWHTVAISQAEKVCDQIVGIGLVVALWCFALSIITILDFINLLDVDAEIQLDKKDNEQ